MIDSPYRTLATATGHEHSWRPDWAQRLQVHRTDCGQTIYSSNPDSLEPADLEDLLTLHREGWQLFLDGPRLGRVRIQLTRTEQEETK